MDRSIRLGHVALYARNRKRLQSFYESILDMKMLHSDDRLEITQLAFDPEAGLPDLSVVGHPKQVFMTFYVDSLDLLTALWKKVRDNGIPTGEWNVRQQGVSFHFNDPEGNRIEMAWVNEANGAD